MKTSSVGILMLILAAAFGLYETAYFGWNALPQSPAELICDGITALLTALAMLAYTRAKP